MAKIKIHYNGRTPEIVQSEEVVSGQLKTIEIQFTFSEEWDMYANRTAVFTSSAATREWPLNEEGTVRIPGTVICSGVRAMAVSVFGVAQDENGEYQRYNGKLAGFRVEMGGRVPGEGCKDAEPSMYEVLLTAIAKKLDAYQGTENAGKVLVVGEDGGVAPGEEKESVELDTTLTQSGKAADAKAVGDRITEQGKTIPKVFKWANSELPFTENEISGVASGGGFVVNPTNFADGKTYFRYHAGSTCGFRWENPNKQKGSLTITMRGYSQYSTTLSTAIFVEYTDGTNSGFQLPHGETVTYTTDPDKTVDYIRGNYDFENWVLLDMDVLSIVADYPAPTGTVKSVNGILPDENGNVEIPMSGGTLVEPAAADIPKIFFDSPLQQTKDEIVTTFHYRSKTLSFDCYAEIKAQGNSTMNWPKKNQTVKLYADADCSKKLKVDFKGWGKQNKFVIKANWRDLTHVRDIVSVRLEGDCMRTNPDFDELPGLLRTSPNLGGIDGFPVVVYAAGVYQGRYMWNIPKDAWMTNMDDELDEHCILCSEDYNSSCFRTTANINGNDWTDEIHDTVPASIRNRWNEVIRFVMNSTDEEFVENLDRYIKVSTLIDRHLMGLLSCDFDGYGKNQLYITYDGKQWYADRYDKDGTWGNYWSGNSMLPSNYGREQYEDMISGRPGNLLFIRLEQLFWARLQTRWAELRAGALSIPNVINRFRELYDITPPYLIAEDYASTTANGAFTGIPNQTTCTIQQIQKFVVERHAWMDEYIAGLTPEEAIPCTGVSFDKSTLTFTAEGTQTVTATVTPDGCTDTLVWVSSNPSVASIAVDGYVCAVTAKTNGSATITATCGGYSATCTVSVSGIEAVTPGALPSAYTELVYIESTGTQYIDTGVSGGTNAAYEIQLNPLGAKINTYEHYFAGDKASIIPKLYSNGSYAGKIVVEIENVQGVQIAHNTMLKRTISYNTNGDGAVYLDGEVAASFDGIANNGWGNLSWYVCAGHGEVIKATMRLFGLKMWSDGELVREFIPALRNSDSVAGLYDLVNMKFHENIGTGSFVYSATDEPAPSEEAIYSLSEATTFDGVDDYVDTGVALFQSNEDFAVTIEFAGNATQSSNSNIPSPLHCVYEVNPWPGISIDINNNIYRAGGTNTNIVGTDTNKHRIVFTKNASRGEIVCYWDDVSQLYVNTNENCTVRCFDKTLLLGCKQDSAGVKNNFWSGTIYNCAVYERQLTTEEITAYLNS